MREIKFRGKRIDNGEWVYGHYYEFEGYEPRIYGFGKDVKDMTGFAKDIHGEGWGYHHVRPATVSQFTGLKNKNGEEIYEGDVLKYIDKTDYPTHSETKDIINVVKFQRGKFNASMFAGISETIGNIFDSPELNKIRT